MPDPVERRLAAIMFTDIVGSTALMAKSEPVALRVKQRHRTLVRTQVDRYHGELIEAPGDETLSIFGSALDAVSCALAIQAESGLAGLPGVRTGGRVRLASPWGRRLSPRPTRRRACTRKPSRSLSNSREPSPGDARSMTTLARAYAYAGRREDALRILEEVQGSAIDPLRVAYVYAALGDADVAFDGASFNRACSAASGSRRARHRVFRD